MHGAGQLLRVHSKAVPVILRAGRPDARPSAQAKSQYPSGFTSGLIGVKIGGMMAPTRPTKITFGEMRDTGVRGILIYYFAI
jgi:hypothetical protein